MSRSDLPTSRPLLLAVLCALLMLGLIPAAVAQPPTPTRTSVPAPDLLDVDLSTGSLADTASGRESELFGAQPEIGRDRALGRQVATFDGSNAVRYDFSGAYDTSEFTVECTIRVDGPESLIDDRNNFCGSKEAGGFSLNAGDQAKVLLNLDGTYYTVAADISPGVWYHVVGVWDGAALMLYVNGEIVDEVPTTGDEIKVPTSEHLFIAADTDPAGEPEYLSTGQVAQAAVYSTALSADQVAARSADVFADQTDDEVGFDLISPDPDPDARMRGPALLKGEVTNARLLARPLTYELDGEPVSLGDEIGPGLSRGEHTLTYSGRDRLGRNVSDSVTFVAAAIPTGEGTSQITGDGAAQLTARATHPTGGQLRTTFLAGDVQRPSDVQMGLIDAAAYDRTKGVEGDVTLQDASPVKEALLPMDGEETESPSTNQIAALKGNVEFTEVGQTIGWRGNVDPSRQVDLLLLNTETERYEIVDSGRGSSGESIELSAKAAAANDDGGVVRVLVAGVDPFADDLNEPVRDSFADPEKFDFSLMHITDPQYQVAGSLSKKSAEERKVWRDGYQDSYRWLAKNAEKHKVEFVGHTGDLADIWRKNSTDVERARAEFEVASASQRILDDTGIPNTVLPGNHDNQDGEDSGRNSLYNSYFGPERYAALARSQGWRQRDAEYHPWKPGDNDNNYVLFTAGGEDFVVVSLGYQVTDAEADWASGVFGKYSDRNGIVMTHAAHSTSLRPDGRDGLRSPDGERISERVMEKNPNVMLMLAGHVTGAAINVRTDVGQHGNNVLELTHDYQSYRISSDKLGITDVGGYDGDTPVSFGATFFRLLQFDLARGELSVDTYSAHLSEFGATEYDVNKRYDGREDDFRVPIQVQGRTTSLTTDSLLGLTATEKVIDDVTHASDANVTVGWQGLKQGTPYGWYAVTQDADNTVPVSVLRAAAMGRTEGQGADFEDGIVQFNSFTASG